MTLEIRSIRKIMKRGVMEITCLLEKGYKRKSVEHVGPMGKFITDV